MNSIFSNFCRENKSNGLTKIYEKDKSTRNKEKENAKDTIRDVDYNAKQCVGKLTEARDNIENLLGLKGENITRIIKIFKKELNGKSYNLLIKEKTKLVKLRDISSLISNMYDPFHLYGVLNNPFYYNYGDNVIRYFTKQVLNGLEVFDRKECAHLNICPSNLLLFPNLTLKINNLSTLIDLKREKEKCKDIFKKYQNEIFKDNDKYVKSDKYEKYEKGELYNLEWFREDQLNDKIAKKQDYFALGAIIFYLKTGEKFFQNEPRTSSERISEDRILDMMQKQLIRIQSDYNLDNNLVDLLTNILCFDAEEISEFGELYRSKWVNENDEEISMIKNGIWEDEETKHLLEINKSYYLIKLRKYFEKNNKENKQEEKNDNVKDITSKIRGLRKISKLKVDKK